MPIEPLLFHQENQLELFLYDADPLKELLSPADYLGQLEPHELQQAQNFTQRFLGQQWLLQRWLAKRAIASYTEQSVESIRWQTTSTGKPVQPSCSLSVSHTGSVLAVLLGPSEYSLGIDCESLEVSPLIQEKALRLIRYFHPADQAHLYLALETDCFVPTFLTLWTRSEALYKLAGRESLAETLGKVALLDSPAAHNGMQVDGIRTLGTDFRLPCLLSYAWSLRV
ncbi:hypothetical protein E4U03_07265 [Rothia nasimurium]|uniref:4'-phosphopantetheinyl transferase superfamily protein n=1 Tax=Rothia nasimurium TaxID=85336 RepID=A0A4Y9F465_9MICC|nr:hypothetical protein [Rothia nasimurium]MBF0808407.1 hypothetical protein [Rothia nasimurium]TFU22112.1 hypothetical protein E4U03_07265 [Rothia nasimurium]